MQISIPAGSRVGFVGKTGSGKTYLARYLLKTIPRLLVIDPKGTLGGDDWNLEPFTEKAAKHVMEGGKGRLRVAGLTAGNAWNAALDWAEAVGNITVYIDEMYGVVNPGSKPGPELTALYTRGRERNIGTWASTQRPTWVPLFALSEAEWLFVFRLNLEEDRERMAEFGGAMLARLPEDDYGFWIYNTSWKQPVYSAGLQANGVI